MDVPVLVTVSPAAGKRSSIWRWRDATSAVTSTVYIRATSS